MFQQMKLSKIVKWNLQYHTYNVISAFFLMLYYYQDRKLGSDMDFKYSHCNSKYIGLNLELPK